MLSTLKGAIALAICCGIGAGALEINENFVAVNGKLSGLPAQNASVFLGDYWKKLFGKNLNVVSEKDFRGSAGAIFLNEDPELDRNEWRIRSDGKNLHISGGHPKGLFYGVAEFLERFAGCRWFFQRNEYIPKIQAVSVPDGQDFRRQPCFPLSRSNSGGIWDHDHSVTQAMNKADGYYGDTWRPSHFSLHSLGGCHTFVNFTKTLKPDEEYMLPVDDQGKHIRDTAQICFANKDFRKHVKKQLRQMIADRQREMKKYGLTKDEWMPWIDISQNDHNNYCKCEGCKELIRKYGTLSGAMLDFINDIAEEFPEHIIQTFAYNDTSFPPKNIRARDNVMIQFAFLNDGKEYYDVMRPLSHPVNAEIKRHFLEWNKICKRKAVWCYHRFYTMTEAFPWPQCSYWYIPEDFRFYKEIGAVKLYDESEKIYTQILHPRAFDDLHLYLSNKMMDDPYQDAQKLIDEFFRIQYGKAAPVMRQYADYLRRRLEAIPGRICVVPLKARACFDEDFFTTINDFLDQAENMTQNDPRASEFVRLERLPVDYAAINMWERFGKLFPSRNFLCDRLERGIRMAITRYVLKPGEKLEQNNLFKLEMLKLREYRQPLPLPPGQEFQNGDVRQMTALCIDPRAQTPDHDAAYGIAATLFKTKPEFDHDRQPMEFGVYNYNTKAWRHKYVIQPEKVPQDEKYHLYHLGRWDPQDGDYLWGHRSWQLRICSMYTPFYSPQDFGREYDFYVSCKMTGPAYVKGSKQKNAVYVDRIIGIKRDLKSWKK